MLIFFIGLATGVYVMDVVIALVLRLMGSEHSVLNSFLWPIAFIVSDWKK